jgi:NhaA family Na+:H+ antiporter
VFIALIWANLSPQTYSAFLHTPIIGHEITVHFLVNDIFMVFFFAIAGIGIVDSLSPGGALHPINKSITPLMATAGGIIGPIVVFFILINVFHAPEYANGWGICTATDIALSWLLGRIVFGSAHPAVSFLLLLAVADDAIGLAIIAIFYPDPTAPGRYIWLLLVVGGMAFAFLLKKLNVDKWWIYIIGPGVVAWIGMHNANLHPALSLVFIVPFLYRSKASKAQNIDFESGWDIHPELKEDKISSPLEDCEKSIGPFVDYGLILFGLSNAGVAFSNVSPLTWIILISLIVGKTMGITLFSYLARLCRMPLPVGMHAKEIITAGFVAGMGLTVALFVAGAAFTDGVLQGAAKMGALFTAIVFLFAPLLGKAFGIKRINTKEEKDALIAEIDSCFP